MLLAIRVAKDRSLKLYIKIIVFLKFAHHHNVIDLIRTSIMFILFLNQSIGTIIAATFPTTLSSGPITTAVLVLTSLVIALACIYSLWRLMFGFLFFKWHILCYSLLWSRDATRMTGFFRYRYLQVRYLLLLRDFIDWRLWILA